MDVQGRAWLCPMYYVYDQDSLRVPQGGNSWNFSGHARLTFNMASIATVWRVARMRSRA